MIKLDFYGDEDLSNSVKRMISALLPHEEFDSSFFLTGLDSLIRTIKPEEMPIPFRLLSHVLAEVNKINISVQGYEPIVQRESMEHILSANLEGFMTSNPKDCQIWAERNSLDLNFSIPDQVQAVQIAIYTETLSLYDECFNLKVPSNQIPMLIITLAGAFKSNAVSESLRTQYEILDRGCWVGRKKLLGAEGVLEYERGFLTDLSLRLDNMDDDITIVDDPSKMAKINDENKSQSQVIAKWGIPELDDCTPILRHRLVGICANPNVGKTLYMSYLTSRLIFNGVKVAYMLGESTENKIKNNVSSNHIYREHNRFVTSTQISGIEESSDEAKRLINISDMEITKTGNLITKKFLSYDNFYNDVKDLYEKTKFDVLVVDHTGSLKSSPNSKLFTMKQKLDEMIYQARQFKKDYPVCIIFLSHLSVDAASDLKKFGRVYSSPSKDSGALDKESDEEFILYDNETLSASGLKGMQIYKRRDREAPKNDIIFKVRKNVVDFEYNPNLQTQNDKLTKDEALNKIDKLIDVGSTSDSSGFSVNDLLNDDDDD